MRITVNHTTLRGVAWRQESRQSPLQQQVAAEQGLSIPVCRAAPEVPCLPMRAHSQKRVRLKNTRLFLPASYNGRQTNPKLILALHTSVGSAPRRLPLAYCCASPSPTCPGAPLPPPHHYLTFATTRRWALTSVQPCRRAHAAGDALARSSRNKRRVAR